MTSQGRRQIKTIIGENIRAAREARGWSQADLARHLPGLVESPSISRWERGIVTPGMPYMTALADVFERDLAWFYTDRADEPGPVAA